MTNDTTMSCPPHLLVIDDEPAMLSVYRELLSDEGFRVTLQHYPPASPAEVAALAPDLIILDLIVGGEPAGWHFLQRLKAEPSTASIPVLVCTADYRFLEGVREQLTAWDCGIIPKPFDVDELLGKVRGCLSPQPSAV